MFWSALCVALTGASFLASAAIGSGILGVAAIYEVAACRLAGAIALQLIAKIFGMMANKFVSSLSQDSEQPSLSGVNWPNYHH